MTEYLFIGIVVSLLFSELTQLSPGGIIVPAYFAMYLYQPQRLVSTFVVAILSVLILRGFSRVMILYGRRKFALFLLTGMAIKAAIDAAYRHGAPIWGGLSLSIGWLVPGLLAKDMEKQGVILTSLCLFVCALLIRVIHRLVIG